MRYVAQPQGNGSWWVLTVPAKRTSAQKVVAKDLTEADARDLARRKNR